MTQFTPLAGLAGGLLIGLASVLLLLGIGRIAGISGIFGGLLPPKRADFAWRLCFLAGLFGGGWLWPRVSGAALPLDLQAGWSTMLLAGFIVGFGTRLGGGCTSGHGISGIARLAPRSMVATAVFLTSAFITVFISRHLSVG